MTCLTGPGGRAARRRHCHGPTAPAGEFTMRTDAAARTAQGAPVKRADATSQPSMEGTPGFTGRLRTFQRLGLHVRGRPGGHTAVLVRARHGNLRVPAVPG